MEQILRRRSLSSMPYSNCQTRIVDLLSLKIPERATDAEYQQIYQTYIQQNTEHARHLRDAIESIRYGIAPPVAFPTETVYGLGADATNEPAVAGIFAAKSRPSDNPLIVHVASTNHLERVVDEPLPEIYKPVVERFWPGPITILLPIPKDSKFANNVHPGQDTIGFRMPASRYARFFIAASESPIAGPSANSSGKPSPTTAHHVLDDLNGKINFILDGGPCQVGVESTVVDGLHDPPLILRPGGVSREELAAIGGRWAHTAIGYEAHSNYSSPNSTPNAELKQNGFVVDINGAPRAPGMKYRHYAPKARLILFSRLARRNGRVREKFDSLRKPTGRSGKICVGFLSRTWGYRAGLDLPKDSRWMEDVMAESELESENYEPYWREMKCTHTDRHILFDIGVADRSKGAITELAQELFALLRFFDDLRCDYIFAETVERDEAVHTDKRVVDAVADRLDKAAAERIDE